VQDIKIKKILPHRYPFIFIDKVEEVDLKNKKIICKKKFSISEYFFKGHFPQNPVAPGVLLIESMAQSAIILYASIYPEIAKLKPDYYLGKVSAKFLNPVKIGDVLKIEVKMIKSLKNAGIVEAECFVEDKKVCEGVLSFGVKVNSTSTT